MHRLTPAAALAALFTAAAGPALAQTSNWNGFYVGGHGGWAGLKDSDAEVLRFDRNLDGTFGEAVTTAAAADAFSPGFCGGAANSAVAADGCSSDGDGSDFGARVGYDYQMGSFVIGAIGEWSAVDANDRVTGFSTTPANYIFERDLKSVAALRMRLGYAMGPALIYGTGGYAWGKVDQRFTTSNTANAFANVTQDGDSADGHQIGGGLEYRLAGGWALFGEYLRTSLDVDPHVVRVTQGSAPATNPFVLAPNTAGTDIVRSEDRLKVNSLRIGLNYRF